MSSYGEFTPFNSTSSCNIRYQVATNHRCKIIDFIRFKCQKATKSIRCQYLIPQRNIFPCTIEMRFEVYSCKMSLASSSKTCCPSNNINEAILLSFTFQCNIFNHYVIFTIQFLSNYSPIRKINKRHNEIPNRRLQLFDKFWGHTKKKRACGNQTHKI